MVFCHIYPCHFNDYIISLNNEPSYYKFLKVHWFFMDEGENICFKTFLIDSFFFTI